MQTQTIERRYSLVKIRAGDYVFHGNDGKTLYRVLNYVEGPSSGLMDWPRDRWVWAAYKYGRPTIPNAATFREDLELHRHWHEVSYMHDTRHDAIQSALADA